MKHEFTVRNVSLGGQQQATVDDMRSNEAVRIRFEGEHISEIDIPLESIPRLTRLLTLHWEEWQDRMKT